MHVRGYRCLGRHVSLVRHPCAHTCSSQRGNGSVAVGWGTLTSRHLLQSFPEVTPPCSGMCICGSSLLCWSVTQWGRGVCASEATASSAGVCTGQAATGSPDQHEQHSARQPSHLTAPPSDQHEQHSACQPSHLTAPLSDPANPQACPLLIRVELI